MKIEWFITNVIAGRGPSEQKVAIFEFFAKSWATFTVREALCNLKTPSRALKALCIYNVDCQCNSCWHPRQSRWWSFLGYFDMFWSRWAAFVVQEAFCGLRFINPSWTLKTILRMKGVYFYYFWCFWPSWTAFVVLEEFLICEPLPEPWKTYLGSINAYRVVAYQCNNCWTPNKSRTKFFGLFLMFFAKFDHFLWSGEYFVTCKPHLEP